jgi:hypothetical protein
MANNKLRITVAQAFGTFPDYMRSRHGVVLRAAATTMDEVRDIALNAGRASIAAAGFPVNMQKALRALKFPRGDTLAHNPAVYIWHRASYANIFEDGGVINGNPMLWLPMGIPPKLGREATTPKLVASKGVKLISFQSRKGTPLLGAQVRVKTKRQNIRIGERSYPWALIKKGTEGKGGYITTLPLFHGISTVNMPKKWGVRAAAEAAYNAIPSLFTTNFINAQADENG